MARPPLGVAHVDGLDGAPGAKRRLRAVLQTLTGELEIEQACKGVGIRPTRFAELRHKALQAALESLEPGIPGRPRKDAARDERVAQLEREIRRLEIELQLERTRAEVAMVMPELLTEPRRGGKKAPARRRRDAPRRSGAGRRATTGG